MISLDLKKMCFNFRESCIPCFKSITLLNVQGLSLAALKLTIETTLTLNSQKSTCSQMLVLKACVQPMITFLFIVF